MLLAACIKYSMRGLICDVISVWFAKLQYGSECNSSHAYFSHHFASESYEMDSQTIL